MGWVLYITLNVGVRADTVHMCSRNCVLEDRRFSSLSWETVVGDTVHGMRCTKITCTV